MHIHPLPVIAVCLPHCTRRVGRSTGEDTNTASVWYRRPVSEFAATQASEAVSKRERRPAREYQITGSGAMEDSEHVERRQRARNEAKSNEGYTSPFLARKFVRVQEHDRTCTTSSTQEYLMVFMIMPSRDRGGHFKSIIHH